MDKCAILGMYCCDVSFAIWEEDRWIEVAAHTSIFSLGSLITCYTHLCNQRRTIIEEKLQGNVEHIWSVSW